MSDDSAEEDPSTVERGDLHDGFDDINFGAIQVEEKRQEYLEMRRKVEEGKDPVLNAQISELHVKLAEKKRTLKEQMELQMKWIQERTKMEKEQLELEEKQELEGLVSYLHEELNDMRKEVEEKINKVDIFDRRTLDIVAIADRPLRMDMLHKTDDKSESAFWNPERKAMPGRLISDTAIREDLAMLNQSFATVEPADVSEVAKPVRPRHRVVMDKNRLIYDGKTFYRGQKLFVQTMNYTRFPAIVFGLADEYVHIRSRTPGDTREVFATIDDLRTGRVRIGRKIPTD